jgi:hypothetical protein
MTVYKEELRALTFQTYKADIPALCSLPAAPWSRIEHCGNVYNRIVQATNIA